MAARKLIGQVLKELGYVHEGMIQEALVMQARRSQRRLGEILIQLGHIGAEQLARGAGRAVRRDLRAPGRADARARRARRRSRPDVARVYGALPLRMEGDKLLVALDDPQNVGVLDDLAFTAGCELMPALTVASALAQALEDAYGADQQGGDVLGQAVEELAQSTALKGFDLEDKEAMASAAPVVKLLNYILYQAIRDQASDIHLEPFEHDFKIRYRVDGVLYELKAPPPHLAIALISRVKVMANLDIAETRLPQDGRIELTVGGQPVDLRVSTLPTMFGESCVMRVLDRSVVSLRPQHIGLRDDDLETLPEACASRTASSSSRGRRARARRRRSTRRSTRLNEDRDEDHHRGGPRRVRPRRHVPGPGQRGHRRHLRGKCCARSCARTPTRSWSARSATSRLRSHRGAGCIAHAATSCSRRSTPTTRRARSPGGDRWSTSTGLEPFLLTATILEGDRSPQRLVRRDLRRPYDGRRSPARDALRELCLPPRGLGPPRPREI
jgi:hypothetical protein